MTDEIDGYITLEKAAELAGYRVTGNLRTAAATGTLKTVMVGRRHYLTRREWLDEYLASRRSGNYGRGKEREKRKPRRPASEEPQ